MSEEIKHEEKNLASKKQTNKKQTSKISLESFLNTVDVKLRKGFEVWLKTKKENKSLLKDKKTIPEWNEIVKSFLKSEA